MQLSSTHDGFGLFMKRYQNEQIAMELAELRGQSVASSILMSYLLDALINKKLLTLDAIETMMAHTNARLSFVFKEWKTMFSSDELERMEHQADLLLSTMWDDLPRPRQ